MRHFPFCLDLDRNKKLKKRTRTYSLSGVSDYLVSCPNLDTRSLGPGRKEISEYGFPCAFYC